MLASMPLVLPLLILRQIQREDRRPRSPVFSQGIKALIAADYQQAIVEYFSETAKTLHRTLSAAGRTEEAAAVVAEAARLEPSLVV